MARDGDGVLVASKLFTHACVLPLHVGGVQWYTQQSAEYVKRCLTGDCAAAALEAVTQGAMHLVSTASPAQLQHLHVLLSGASNARARKALAELKAAHEADFRFKGKV